MAIEDLEYVERTTGVSLDDDKPLSDIKRKNTMRQKEQQQRSASAGISVEKKPEYDWFDFFLQCGVNPQICERYAMSFHKDQMGEENLPDISDKLLRTLGLKEGDILRVMKFLDKKFGREADREKRSVSFGGASVIQEGDEANGSPGGLFSGPGGMLRNNTRKGRPAPPVQTNDVVDPKAFEQKSDDAVKKPTESGAGAGSGADVSPDKVEGFEDNAWDVKPSRQPAAPTPAPAASAPPASTPATSTTPAPAAPAVTTTAPPAPNVPALTGSLGELSLLMPAIKPEEPAQPTPQQQPTAAPQAPAQPIQPTGATPSLFDQVAAVKAQPPQQLAPPRMRPSAPPQQNTGGLIAPPPQRASSAPMNQQSAFGPPPPLQPQLTGYVGAPNMHAQVAPPGQSLSDLQQQRLVQQQMTGYPQQQPGFQYGGNGMMPQPIGIMPQPTGMMPMGFTSPQPMMPQPTGFAPFQQPQPTGFQQPQQTGFQPQFQLNQNQSPFANPPGQPQFQPLQSQPTGFTTFSPSPLNPQQTGILNPQATGINRFLPPAIQPSMVGSSPSPPSIPPMPPMPAMPTAQPLVPQKTGPPPPVRFGVQPAKKLTPQPTGRANLAKASKFLITMVLVEVFVLTV